MHLQSSILATIRDAWGWTGIVPVIVTAANDFGNLVIQATNGEFWRICPETLRCEIIAHTKAKFEAIWADSAFQQDWQMARLVEVAAAKFGILDDDRCYCLKVQPCSAGSTPLKTSERFRGTNSLRRPVTWQCKLKNYLTERRSA